MNWLVLFLPLSIDVGGIRKKLVAINTVLTVKMIPEAVVGEEIQEKIKKK